MKDGYKELETPRLILKKGTYEDYKVVYEYNFTKLRDINGEFEYVKLDNDEFLKAIAVESSDEYDWCIYLKEGMIPIGNIVAHNDNELYEIELSYNLHPTYWGLGIMKEAVIEVMDLLYSIGYKNILCGYDGENVKSKSVIEKLGFIPYSTTENSWFKDGIGITKYEHIMSVDKYRELYNTNLKSK